MAKQITSVNPARIKVIGCGGGGCNAVNRMAREGIEGIELIAVNTDCQSLQLMEAPTKIPIGERLTRGLGAGGDHLKGRKAAEESQDDLRQVIAGADMIFITAGMGGGTGTGSAPFVAKLAKDAGILTIGIVTKPFRFEGAHRGAVADEGIEEMVQCVDTLIIIPNDKLLEVTDAKTVVDSAFKMADDVLGYAVKAITEVITVPGLINLDFADVKAVMVNGGQAWLSMGRGTGPNRSVEAAKAALHSPLLEVSIKGAKGVLYNISGGPGLTLHEVEEAAKLIQSEVDKSANIIFGVIFDNKLETEIRITLIATGFSKTAGSVPKLEELKQVLKHPESEGEMDIPTFIRRPNVLRRMQYQPQPQPFSGHPAYQPKQPVSPFRNSR